METFSLRADTRTRKSDSASRQGISPEFYISAAVFLLSFSYLLLFRRYTTMEPDEGIVLQGAQRILHGQVMYRDFFSFLTPGSFYLHAFLFRIFGSSFIVPRTSLAFIGGVFSLIGYLLARRVCSRASTLLGIVLLTFTTLPYRFLTLHNWDSTLLALLGLYCAVRMAESGRSGWIFAIGSLTSLTALFEQSKGAGMAVGLLLGFGVLWKSNRFVLNGKQCIWLIAGFTWPFLITFIYFGSQHAIPAMLGDWLWPIRHYTAANRVRFGYANWSEETRHLLWETGSLGIRGFRFLALSPTFLVPALMIIAVGLFCYWSYKLVRAGATAEQPAYYCVVTGVLVGLLLSVVMVRADIIHFMYLQPISGLLLVWIFDGRNIPGRLFKAVHPIVSAFLILAFLLFAIPLLLRAVNAPYKLETRRGVITTPEPDTVTPFTQARVAPGASVFVYPYLPLYNYFTATFSPTSLDYFQPGMNTPEQSQAILNELKSGGVPIALFEPQFPLKIPSSWPGTPEKEIAQDPVADYIAAHYRICGALSSPEQWRIMYMVRADLECR